MRAKKLQIALFFMTFSFFSCHAQQENVHVYVKKLIAGKRHESQIIGIGLPGYQWPHYLKFKELATKKQLVRFCHHTNGVIRAYAFQALLEVDLEAAKKIFDEQKDLQMEVPIMRGCVTFSPSPLPEVYRGLVWSKFPWSIENIETDSTEKAHFTLYYEFTGKH